MRLAILFVVMLSALLARADCFDMVECPFHHELCDWHGEVFYDDAGAEHCVYECSSCPYPHRYVGAGR